MSSEHATSPEIMLKFEGGTVSCRSCLSKVVGLALTLTQSGVRHLYSYAQKLWITLCMNILNGCCNPSAVAIFGSSPKNILQKMSLINSDDAVSCNIAATSMPWEAANLLGLWIEMICQYAIWPNLAEIFTSSSSVKQGIDDGQESGIERARIKSRGETIN